MAHARFLPWLGVLLLVTACAETRPPEPEGPPDYARPLPPGAPALVKITDPAEFPDCGVAYTRGEDLRTALAHSLAYLEKPSSHRHFPQAGITHERCRASLEAFREILVSSTGPEAFQAEILRRFDFYRAYGYDGRGAVFVTGYCTPIYPGRLERTDRFRFPLYRLPPEIVKDDLGNPLGQRNAAGEYVACPTRAEIENGDLYAGRGLELVWLESPVDVYVVQVQGSAKVRLEDGRLLHVGYAGKTEHPYVSVGRALVDAGKVPAGEMSLPAFRRYFRDHPDEVRRWLQLNPSYVFFQEYPPGMPHGSLGCPVTPRRTVATDKTIFPRAAVLFLEVDVSAGGTRRTRFREFVLDQDTGGAIRAAGRADLYFGVGDGAERLAGRQSAVGRMVYLFLRE
jgi:membrane-bound lytic murein transglycosylase A